MAKYSGIVCLMVLASVYNAAAQCGNSGGSCPHITDISQCTAEVLETCCSKCGELAGCFNLGTNCFTDYDSKSCYTGTVRNNCCLMCKHFEQSYLGGACLYGDRNDGCDSARCGTSDVYDNACCGTCYDGTPPPPVCVDSGASCTNSVRNVPSPCYDENDRISCCISCSRYQSALDTIGVDVATCPYGDKAAYCQNIIASDCNANNAVECCETCKDYVPPPATTTTEAPACTDNSNTCASRVNEIPSLCYDSDERTNCCKSCNDFKAARMFLGRDVERCPYGSRQDYCLFNFDTDRCRNPNVRFDCCDECADDVTAAPSTTTITTIPPTCEDSGVFPCNLSPRFCYQDVSQSYRQICCATCREQSKPHLGARCLYGDKEEGCDALVGDQEECSDELESSCCETCRGDIPPPCQDSDSSCPALVNNQARNCYDLGELCCASCSRFVKPRLPETCRYGDRLSACSANSCGSLSSLCCETCADPTTTIVPTTTESVCFDTANNCGGNNGLVGQNARRCYNDAIRGQCCGTCQNLAEDNAPKTCPWGDRDSVCSLIQVDCTNAEAAMICCKTCADTMMTTTPMPSTPPTGCMDSLTTCDMLTESLFNCYAENSGFISNGCCATCWSKRKLMLGPQCIFGDRIQFCSTFISGAALCLSDERVRRDCCETCDQYTRTTTTGVTVCPNEWSDATCEMLVEQLGGCTGIQDKCCRTCLTTPVMSTTTISTTMDPCQNVLTNAVCGIIISAEGDKECYTEYMQENCCASCRSIVTTTPEMTTMPECPGDQLSNCAQLQDVIDAGDICDPEFVSNLRDVCCEFCMVDTTSTMMTPTLPPGCEGNIWSAVVCAATISTSNLDRPCMESSVIRDNCCAYCAMTTAAPPSISTMITPVPCEGDDPSINCESLDQILNVCNDDDVAPLCCDYCSPDLTTTTMSMTTGTPAGPCRNQLSSSNCQNLFDTQGGITYCATDFMLQNCCLFCSRVTVPPTTTAEPTPEPCNGDNPDLNCANLDVAFGGRLCDMSFGDADDLRPQCCDYCGSMTTPTPTATEGSSTSVTTAPCIDVLTQAACTAIAAAGSCNTTTGITQCCATCRAEGATTSATTTMEPGTTEECVDTTDINCTALATTINVCTPDLIGLCCAYCRDLPITTEAPTSEPCFGNQLPAAVCIERNRTSPNFCGNDDVWTPFCCEFCGSDVVTLPGSTTTADPDATTPDRTSPEVITTSTPFVCNGNVFSQSLCQSRVSSFPDSCDTQQWYQVCCEYCDSLTPIARRRRSVDTVSRQKRQVPPSSCVNQFPEETCVSLVYSSTSTPKTLICTGDTMIENCCAYCAEVSLDDTIPDGEQKNDLLGGLLAKLFN